MEQVELARPGHDLDGGAVHRERRGLPVAWVARWLGIHSLRLKPQEEVQLGTANHASCGPVFEFGV